MDNAVNSLAGLLCLNDFETAARQRLEHKVFEFIASGAADEITLRWNRDAFDGLALLPRALESKLEIDTRISLLGETYSHPILLAPVSSQRLIYPDGEISSARAAEAAGTLFVIGGFTSNSVEEIRQAAPRARLWFQPYGQRDMGVMTDSVRRAEAAGCHALCLTLDAALPGVRNRLDRSGFKLELTGLPHSGPDRPTTWEDVKWVRNVSPLPIVVKGILHPDDARRAVDAGAAAVGVSNHGGRCLDTAMASIDALPAVLEAVNGRVPVLVDGGIRRGTDVLKAIALGARAVMIGRPYVYGLGLAGAVGVAKVMEILWRELSFAMALTGQLNINTVDRGVVRKVR